MAYGDDDKVRTFLVARTVGIRVQVTALQLVEEDVEKWVPVNAGTESKMAYAPKIKETKERETPLYDQRMGAMTTQPVIDLAARRAAFAQVRVPNGKGGTTQPLMRPCPAMDATLAFSPGVGLTMEALQAKERWHDNGRCGCVNGVVPIPYGFGDIVAVMHALGFNLKVLDRQDIVPYALYFWRDVHTMERKYGWREYDPADPASVDAALLNAAIDAARAAGALAAVAKEMTT